MALVKTNPLTRYKNTRRDIRKATLDPIENLLTATEYLVSFYQAHAQDAWQKGYDAGTAARDVAYGGFGHGGGI